MAEQAVRKAVAAYSKGADRSDLDILKFASHDDAEVKYGSYDGHRAMKCASHSTQPILRNWCEHIARKGPKSAFLLFYQHINQPIEWMWVPTKTRSLREYSITQCRAVIWISTSAEEMTGESSFASASPIGAGPLIIVGRTQKTYWKVYCIAVRWRKRIFRTIT